MANTHRGEIDAELNGERYRLCLTLGALAELESAFGNEDMVGLATRFESGRISAHDAMRVIGAGLRGAGYEIRDAEVGAMQCAGGAAGFVAIVAKLLSATFGSGVARAGGESEAVGPFPWDDVMAAGLGVLRLEPRAFWAMTPRELAAAFRLVGTGSEPPSRSEVEGLMRLHPDG